MTSISGSADVDQQTETDHWEDLLDTPHRLARTVISKPAEAFGLKAKATVGDQFISCISVTNPKAHDTHFRNRRHKSTSFSVEPYAPVMKISGAENKRGRKRHK